MYTIFADDVCIYDDVNNMAQFRVINPTLSLSDNTSGTLTMTLPRVNVGYDTVQRLRTTIKVYRNEIELWEGRVISEQVDFNKNRILTCEGELGYLNDTIQPQFEYENPTPESFIRAIIAEHNSQVGPDKQFTVGNVTVTARMVNEDTAEDEYEEDIYVYTNFDTTLSCLTAKFVNSPDDRKDLKGHFRVRKENGVRYLDFLKDYPRTSTQTIEFGRNLMDFVVDYDESSFCTVLIPLGERYEDGDVYGLEGYLDITEVNDGKNYITNAQALNEFGWIERVEHFDEIEDDEELLTKGRTWLSETQFGKMKLSVTAVDLSYLNVDSDSFKMLDQVRVISNPHGLDKLFPLTEMEIPLDNPGNTTFKLGIDPEDNRDSIASSVGSSGNSIRSIIKEGEHTKARLEVLDNQIESEVEARTSGELTTRTLISQTAHSIELTAESGSGGNAGIRIKVKDEDGNVIQNTGVIELEGVVTFINNNYATESYADSAASSAESNAEYYADHTTIDGGRITTGLISADRIDVDNLVAKSLVTNNSSEGYASVYIKNGRIGFGSQVSSSYSPAIHVSRYGSSSGPYMMSLVNLGAISISTDSTSTYFGTGISISTDMTIWCGPISCSSLSVSGSTSFGYLSCTSFYSSGLVSCSGVSSTGSISGTGLSSSGSLSVSGNASISGTLTTYSSVSLGGRVTTSGGVVPSSNSTYSLGISGTRWSRIFLVNEPDVSSDGRQKKEIETISDRYEEFFMLLSPVTFKRIDDDDSTHVGFIAQEVKEAMDESEVDDFYGYRDDDKESLGLCYGEFIALNTHMIQKQQKRIDELENEVSELKQLVKELLRR